MRRLTPIFELNLQIKFLMKKYLLVLLMVLFSNLSWGQNQAFYAPLDSLPRITIKKSVPLLALSIYFGGFFIANCNHYLVNGHDFYGTAPLKSYLYTPKDSMIIGLYQKHRNNRTIWLASAPVATVAGTVAFAYLIISVFSPRYSGTATPYLVVAYSVLGLSLGTRIASFSQLRRAVNIYNFKYASKTRLSLGIAPASSGVGLGVVARF